MGDYQFNHQLVPTAHQALVQQLLDCKHFDKSDRLLGASRGRGVAWFLATTAELGVDSVKRHYHRGGLFGKWVRDRYLFCGYANSRPYREFQLLQQLAEWGLPVPRPIGCKVARQGLCYQGDILIEKIADTQDLSQYLRQQPLATSHYVQLGAVIRQLHDRQVHHSDLNIHNILRDKQGKFWLIDFDKCHIQAGDRWKMANVDRLHRSFRKEKTRLQIHFNEADWQALLAGYQATS